MTKYQLTIFRVTVFTSSGSMGGRRGSSDAKTKISQNISFSDIITNLVCMHILHRNNLFVNITVMQDSSDTQVHSFVNKLVVLLCKNAI